ncbi:MAG: arginine--tRNA ligase [Schleiferiaceae bacterium]|jgi:arginyl-tRNA synthetase|nr:arginine--tRNA ligase [Schleiferiaceae bacterium]MDP4766905.1 arginine--tRNA ligase [Schleiferiaceae bacterium]MDP4877809.1 arginine--tRNA ligase [Schleiferiaceae bacterium]MDP4958906.1 arginine--tRNA ligase [Schleiferiaceae bacterium]
MSLEQNISTALNALYAVQVQPELQETRKEFDGDLTLVVFPFVRAAKKKPEEVAEEIGAKLLDMQAIAGFNVVKGFLNLSLDRGVYVDQFKTFSTDLNFGLPAPGSKGAYIVEYSSPNTNKPLHLGHIRNNLLGYSVAEILKANGVAVTKVQIINDRGIHICKSMLAWQEYGNGETPDSTGLKGDHLVGKYYVKFDQVYKEEIKALIAEGKTEEEAKKQAPSLLKAQQMLLKWEEGDAGVVALWKTMNDWVYNGFNTTYAKLGVDFDKNYYESQTYVLGKDDVTKGLESGVFYKKEDGSVWIDLESDGLDHKLVLRSDGTSVYMTQDIGTAIQRFKDFEAKGMTYVVGNEQDYHFKVLFLILSKLGYAWAEQLHHLSYGMVDLPSGKMKSREGTVVDADDLIDGMVADAEAISKELGKLDGLEEAEQQELFTTLGLGALKYFILKVDPKKRMLFNPAESIDFNGHTGPFIQYAYARIQSLQRKAPQGAGVDWTALTLNEDETVVIKALLQFPEVMDQAARNFSPAVLANYTYELVKKYNGFYQNNSILKAETEQSIAFRLLLSKKVGEVIKASMNCLGIQVPNRM